MFFISQIATAMLTVVAIYPVGTVVSDTNKYTCGSGSVSSLSSDSRRILAPYLASETGRGECHDIAALADIPVDNPKAARSFVLCRAGEMFCGKEVSSVLCYASMIWKGKLRVFLDVNYHEYGWRDWDIATRKVAGEGVYRCRYGGVTRKLSPDAIEEYLTSLGMKGFNPKKEIGDRCIIQTKPQWVDGAFYGLVTSSCSQPILFKSVDGEILEFVSAIPAVAEYECQLAICGGIFYALMRGAIEDNFWTSSDKGITWKESGRLPDGRQRPQLTEYKGSLLVGYSAPDEKPSKVRNGRNNFHLLKGTGCDLTKYRELLHFIDPIGVVYPDLVEGNGRMYMLWSNSARFPKFVKWGAVQGKDQILHTVLDL